MGLLEQVKHNKYYFEKKTLKKYGILDDLDKTCLDIVKEKWMEYRNSFASK